MLESRVDTVRGSDLQPSITLRNRFGWSVKSVQCLTVDGSIGNSTLTQIVYERDEIYPHRAELEPLEAEANSINFMVPRPRVGGTITLGIFAALFWGIWYLGPTVLHYFGLLGFDQLVYYIAGGIALLFSLLFLLSLIKSIVRGAKRSSNRKKCNRLCAEALRIHRGVAPVAKPSPVMQPGRPVAPQPVRPLPPQGARPVAQPIRPGMAPQGQPQPRPVQPAVNNPSAPRPVQPAQPVSQPAVQPTQPVVQPVVQPSQPVVKPVVVQQPTTSVKTPEPEPKNPATDKPIE